MKTHQTDLFNGLPAEAAPQAEIASGYNILCQKLHHLAHAYYVLDQPEAEDAEYDRLYQQLLSLEAEHPELVTPTSPSQRVGGAVLGGFQTVTHPVRLYSLDNVFDEGGLHDWQARLERVLQEKSPTPLPPLEFVAEMKIDGLAISLLYQNGQLKRATTRGNGVEGEDVTANVKTIRSIPLVLQTQSPPALLEVRAEIFMPRASFVALNQQREADGQPPFANPRNAAAGSIRQLDPAIAASRDLDAYIFSAAVLEEAQQASNFQTNTLWQTQQWLEKIGFKVNPNRAYCKNLAEVGAFIQALDEKRHALPCATDGVVVKLNDSRLSELAGYTAKAPRWAVAYKYAPETAQTQVLELLFSVGRTGVITPVAIMEPVEVAGSVVQRASLHNFDELAKKDVRPGDTVEIHKAAEIIPEVLVVLDAQRPGRAEAVQAPAQCPVCQTPTVKRLGEVALRCPNTTGCPAQVQNRLEHWASKHALDIDGVGPAVMERLLEASLISTPADLYQLTEASFLSLPGFKEKSAQNALASIEKSRQQPLNRLLVALGIPNVGTELARTLAGRFGSLQALQTAPAALLCLIPGIQTETAKGVTDFFAHPAQQALCNQLQAVGLTVQTPHWQASQHWQAAEVSLQALLNQAKQKTSANIKGLGDKTLQTLAEQYQTLPAFLEAPDLPENAQLLKIFFETGEGISLIQALKATGLWELHLNAPKNPMAEAILPNPLLPLQGKTIVLTGTLSQMTRDEAAEALRGLGASISGSVSKNTFAVVAGDKAGSKRTKAETLNVPVVEEAALKAFLANPQQTPLV